MRFTALVLSNPRVIAWPSWKRTRCPASQAALYVEIALDGVRMETWADNDNERLRSA